MKNVLIAVDDTKGSKTAVFECMSNFCTRVNPETVTLVFVEKFEGRSLIDEMLGDAEMSTLREVLEGTEYKQKLDEKANAVLDFHEKSLKNNGVSNVKKVIRSGHPADEILAAAKDEGADMIIVGSRSDRSGKLLMGSVSREVVNHAEVPVLVIR